MSLVELEAKAEIARLTTAMHFAGFEPRLVAYLVERARSGKLAAEALEGRDSFLSAKPATGLPRL